jgi:hypothetical protein
MAPIIRYRFFAVPETVMFMPGKKNQIIPGTQSTAIAVLRDMEDALGADNYHKCIYAAVLMNKILRPGYFPA